MSSSRREFLKRGSWMALAAGLPLGLSEKTPGMSVIPTSEAAGLSMAAFKSQVGSNFLINHEAAKVKLTLVEVTNLASRKQTAAGKEGFSLVFRGPKDATLPQNTYLIEHGQMGMFSFLIVPIRTKNNRAPHYEAIINRLHP